MNKKSLWLKGDWFVSSWVAFYSALERRGALIDKTPPSPPTPTLPPSLPGACDPRVIKYNAQHLKFGNPGMEKRRSKFVLREFTEMIILGLCANRYTASFKKDPPHQNYCTGT